MFIFHHFIISLITGLILAVAAGRRWSHSGLLIFTAVLFFTMLLVAPRHWNLGVHIMQALCSLVKTNTEAAWIFTYLQAVELFPTVVRMSGLGLCHLVSQVGICLQSGSVNFETLFRHLATLFLISLQREDSTSW